jgi:energy-coupling factor transport system permease protein
MIAVVAATAAGARIGRAMVPFALATTPLVISILLVNLFFLPGATDVVVRLGPVSPTWSGLGVGLQATLRVLAFALSVAVFSLTTSADDLLSDLEARGIGRRAAFVIGAAIGTIPRMAERAREIVDAQRARGLDTEGSPWRRVRGVVPLAGPLVLGALSQVEERTLALEARAFSAPGRRTVLRHLPDGPRQRALRWGTFALTVAAIASSIAGGLRLP